MTQRGNALFLILIAVALFAALGYAVTQSSRGGASISKEQELIYSAKIIDEAGAIEQAIGRLQLINKCTDTQLNFDNTTVTGYVNGSAPADRSCNVFDAAGGGLTFPIRPQSAATPIDYYFSGANWYKDIGTGDYPPVPTTTTVADLAMVIPINSASLCATINSKLKLPSSLAMDTIALTKFTGTYATGNFVPDDGGNMAGFYGARSACLQSKPGFYPATVGSGFFFYHIVLAR